MTAARVTRVVAILVATLSLAACGDYLGEDVESGEAEVVERPDVADVSTPTETTTPPAPVDPRSLPEGACVDDVVDAQGAQPPTVAGVVAGAPVVARSCDEEHRYELYARADLGPAEAGWPGPDQLGEDAVTICTERFADYVGVPWSESALDYLALVPDEARWAQGDRSVTCILYDLGLAPLEESMAAG